MPITKQNILFSFDSVLNFEKKCINLSKDIIESIEKVGRLDLANKKDSFIRATILVFVKETLNFFIDRSEFIIEIINKKEIKQEILRNLYRGLIEIYCRVLYMNNINDKEKIKRIIWRELYIVALMCRERNLSNLPSIISLDYKIFKGIDVKFPEFKKFIDIVQNGLINLRDDKEFKKLREEFDFPSVRKVIKNHLNENEEPHISKVDMYYYYCIFSEQIHSNFNLEFSNRKIDPKYQLTAWLILFHLKFLREVSRLINQHNEEVKNLVDEYNSNLKKQLVHLWHIDKQINKK